ncbi:NAD-dependent epimerase/dehydratase family protein [Oceanibacterium hippocampi]|uniref:3 beta-hydroxysteroid dehydrogenase/Delta 5-->4-isomerase n=1 Tax=Oceanibacterium hippocampi TaxID=745714 RepID=A0A1Y5S6L7_9PROT|nr:NAD-dependent epimerase/dehydratase family protein [Oceanibacterium hippocampi]SLN33122.1 3 beta-hydroxysteroid dehydrogenase/Delta 5-->4-isomerase [Oceanibacterium hippocampi]
MKQAFVTGGTGFLGRNLIEQLCQAGWSVTALHRPESDISALDGYPVTLASGALLEPDSLARAIPEGVDAVFHVAANTSVWSRNNERQTAENVDGTKNMLAAARAAGAKRFIHTSTWNVYGLEHDAISETTTKTGADSWINYSRSKALAEEAALAANAPGFEVVVLNPAHVIGRYDRDNWARMIRMVDSGKLPGVPPGAGSFAHAEEVARAHISAAQRGRAGANYLLGGTDASFLEVVTTIGRMLGKKTPKRTFSGVMVRLVARAKALGASVTGKEPDFTPEAAEMVLGHPRIVSSKAANELGYRKVSINVMLDDSIRWLRAEGLIAPE